MARPLNLVKVAPLRRAVWKVLGLAWALVLVLSFARADSSSSNHWAFQPVRRPEIPIDPVGISSSSNPIDAFVRHRLSQAGLRPASESSRSALVRRIHFVMLGLPPTPAEVDAFMSDPRPGAYERLVERVLSDPRYGERWGRHWLDIVRFAESNGFETNRERLNAWRFRDYVIASFNRDTPYAQFVREQIAGDRFGVDVGTGFLVGGPVDIVGSPDPALTAQQRADEIDDMVSTTGTAFLGLTLGCARCHAHKFDPIAHEEYYAMAALFAGVKHGERSLPATPPQKERREYWEARVSEWERKLAPYLVPSAVTAAGTKSTGVKRPAVNAQRNEERFEPVEARHVRFTILASNSGEPCLDELEVWAGDRNVAAATAGAKALASGTLRGFEMHRLEHVNDGKFGNSFSWISDEGGKGWVRIDLPRNERLERMVWGRDRDGQFGDRVATRYKIEVSLDARDWREVASSDDREPFQGKTDPPAPPQYRFDHLPQSEAREARSWLAEFEKARKARDAASKGDQVYAGVFVEPPATHRLHRGDPMQKRETIGPGTLAMFKPLNLATNAPERDRRAQLADWITDAEHPLTSRVFANRVWQYHFGVGLVDTPNDFGRNGARPSHPELLDWLAREFVESGWSVKHLHRMILRSATWRQSSAPHAEGLAKDAGNRLLWRFAPRRIEAEAIRDSMLAVAGALRETGGGPGFYLHEVDRENVYHYHPRETFGPAEWRRMVYAFKVRMEQDGIFGSLDCPDGSLTIPKRSISTTPLQALNLFNSRFVMSMADRFAVRLESEVSRSLNTRSSVNSSGPMSRGTMEGHQIDLAWKLSMGRHPADSERVGALRFVQEQGWPALCRALLNANEFMFIP